MKKVVLVTGASSHLGKICADYLSESGFKVYRISRGDVYDAGSWFGRERKDGDADDRIAEFVLDEVWNKEGAIHALVNCVEYVLAGSVEDTTVEEAQALFEANFFDVLRVCHAVLPLMREQRSGLIINTSSVAGTAPAAFHGVYNASKAALEAFTDAFSTEVEPFGIRVVLVRGGSRPTGEQARVTRKAQKSSIYRQALEGVLADQGHGSAHTSPTSIAALIHQLISEAGNDHKKTVRAQSGTRLVMHMHEAVKPHLSCGHLTSTISLTPSITENTPIVTFTGDWTADDRQAVEKAVIEFELNMLLTGAVLTPSRWLCTGRWIKDSVILVANRSGEAKCFAARTGAELAKRISEVKNSNVPSSTQAVRNHAR